MGPAAWGLSCGLRWLNSASLRAPGGARSVEDPLQCREGGCHVAPAPHHLPPSHKYLFLCRNTPYDTSAEIGVVISWKKLSLNSFHKILGKMNEWKNRWNWWMNELMKLIFIIYFLHTLEYPWPTDWVDFIFQVQNLSLREIKWLTQGLLDSKKWIKNWVLDPLNVNPVPSVLHVAYHWVGMMF